MTHETISYARTESSLADVALRKHSWGVELSLEKKNLFNRKKYIKKQLYSIKILLHVQFAGEFFSRVGIHKRASLNFQRDRGHSARDVVPTCHTIPTFHDGGKK